MKKFYPFSFLALFLSISAQARMVDRTVALVNGDVILQSDLTTFRKNMPLRKEVDPLLGLVSVSPESTKEVQDYLIQEKLILQKSAATEEEVEEEISSVQKNNKINRDQLRDVLKSQGVNFEDYKRLMAISVAKRKLIERELRPLAAVSDEEVKNAYYTDSVFQKQRTGQKLVLSYGLRQLILPSSSMAEEASKRIRSGEDFDAVLADLSSKGADSTVLNSISEENMNSKIREAVQGLKVGEVSKPISAGSGYLLLKVTSVSAPQDPVFEQEKERIRSVLFQKALLNQLKIWTDRERAASYVHISAN